MAHVRLLRCCAAALLASVAVGTVFAHDTESMEELTRAAEREDAESQFALGSGDILEQDFTQAATWCRLGAEQDDADGQLCMASLYAGGCGVEQDYVESARWYLLAADQVSGEAQARLGDMYANGEGGVQRDPVETDKWYQRSAEPGTYHSTKVAGVVIFSGRHLLFHLFVLAKLYQDGIGTPPE